MVNRSTVHMNMLDLLKKLYSTMQAKENNVGGGEGVEGTYGSITQAGTARVLSHLAEQTELDSNSILVDVGAGLGRPLLHAYVQYGVRGFGIELDSVKCEKANPFVHQVLEAVEPLYTPQWQGFRPIVHAKDIEEVPSLDPATHAYSFWQGVPTTAKAAFGRLFAESSTLRAVAVVQHATREDPVDMMEHLGFGRLQLVAQLPVAQQGSGSSYQAYVFKRIDSLFLASQPSAFQTWWCTQAQPVRASEGQQSGQPRRSQRLMTEYGQQKRNGNRPKPPLKAPTAGESARSKLFPRTLQQSLVQPKAIIARSASAAAELEEPRARAQVGRRPGSHTPSTAPSSPRSSDSDIPARSTILRTQSVPQEGFRERMQCGLQSPISTRSSLQSATSMEAAVRVARSQVDLSPIQQPELVHKVTPAPVLKVSKPPTKAPAKSSLKSPCKMTTRITDAINATELVRGQQQLLTTTMRLRKGNRRGHEPDVPKTVPELVSPPLIV